MFVIKFQCRLYTVYYLIRTDYLYVCVHVLLLPQSKTAENVAISVEITIIVETKFLNMHDHKRGILEYTTSSSNSYPVFIKKKTISKLTVH